MSEEFRELERPSRARNKDVVLMATVTSFQALSHPAKSELRQFAELFQPLFAGSSLEARRDAVAALSQSPNLPLSIAAFIASQPIAIAAPFLASSPALSDDLLIMIARTQGADHARAIVKRDKLSPTVIDTLVGLRHSEGKRPEQPAAEMAQAATSEPAGRAAAAPLPGVRRTEIVTPDGAQASVDTDRLGREEALRQTIKTLARRDLPESQDRLGRFSIGAVQAALLVRFARSHEGGLFCTTLADVLSSSRWLAERILIDISGRQLATTLVGVGMEPADAVFVLKALYPHLARMAKRDDGQQDGAESRAVRLIADIEPGQAEARIDSWLRADRYTFGEPLATADRFPAPERMAANGGSVTGEAGLPASLSGHGPSHGNRRPVGDDHGRQVLRARKR